jgi:hypothetical protein
LRPADVQEEVVEIPDMTWWGWLIISIFAWIAADAFLVLFVGWRRSRD